jgi:DNA primase
MFHHRYPIPVDLKDAVLARVDLVELIGQYTALTHSGREWRGRCVFHNEKTASFYVNPEKGVYHCFGCKASGGAIQFVMHVENLEFRDALEWLARRYNIPVEQYERTSPQQPGEKQRLYDLNDAAAAYFREQLKGPKGEAARAYLKKREVGAAQLAEFDLGFALNEWTGLTDHLLSKGAKAADLEKLSLIRKRDNASGYYDFFRNRLIFPIRDVTGRVIGFGGRALSDDDQPKYLNIGATPLYDKGRTLYNLDRAKGRLRDEGAVLVEGYMDVIGLAGAGVQNAVACCGTALTEQHVLVLQKYTDRYYLAFDDDGAGRKAAWSGGVLFLNHGDSPRVLVLDGQDPDEFVREHGLEAWQSKLQSAEHVVEIWLRHQQELHPDATPTQRQRWVGELAALYKSLPNDLLRIDFFKAVENGLLLDKETVNSILGGHVRAKSERGAKAALRSELHQKKMAEGTQPIEREVLRRLLIDPEFRFYYDALGCPDWFTSAPLRELCAQIAAGTPASELMDDPAMAPQVSAIMLAEPLADSNEQLLLRHNNLFLEREIARLSHEFKRASAAGDTTRENELMVKVLELKKQIRVVAGLKDAGYSTGADTL